MTLIAAMDRAYCRGSVHHGDSPCAVRHHPSLSSAELARRGANKLARNLLICCDGTANEFKQDRTNVIKLAFAADKDSSQLIYYHPGVGTMAPPGFFTALQRAIARLAGMAFGYGLKNDVRDVYSFIMDHYEHGDQIYIFGFSRGAYTARGVVALLHAYGLLSKGNAALVPYAIRLLWKYHRARTKRKKSQCFQLAREFRKALSAGDCPIRFLGLWDTVSSVGWISSPLSLPYTRKLPGVEIIRHAVAIDERRAFFRTNLIERNTKRNIQEVWFPGVHCDVGGGYPEDQSSLSKIPLKWMIDEASAAGLRFDGNRVHDIMGGGPGNYVTPQPNAPAHNSLLPIWWLAEFVPKKYWYQETDSYGWRPNLFRRRHFRAAPVIDDSAWLRGDSYKKRLPADAIKRTDAELGLAEKFKGDKA